MISYNNLANPGFGDRTGAGIGYFGDPIIDNNAASPGRNKRFATATAATNANFGSYGTDGLLANAPFNTAFNSGQFAISWPYSGFHGVNLNPTGFSSQLPWFGNGGNGMLGAPLAMSAGLPFAGAENMTSPLTINAIYNDTDKEFVIDCIVPGVTAKTFDLTIVGDEIRIRPNGSDSFAQALNMGNTTGRKNKNANTNTPFYAVPVPRGSDTAKIKAKVTNGILSITIPKIKEIVNKIRKIKVT